MLCSYHSNIMFKKVFHKCVEFRKITWKKFEKIILKYKCILKEINGHFNFIFLRHVHFQNVVKSRNSNTQTHRHTMLPFSCPWKQMLKCKTVINVQTAYPLVENYFSNTFWKWWKIILSKYYIEHLHI